MRVIYNGVDLMAIQTHIAAWEPIYDDTGTDYLYTRVDFGCRGIINGMASVVEGFPTPVMDYGFGGTNTTLRTGSAFSSATSPAPAPPQPRADGPYRSPKPTPTANDGLFVSNPSKLREIVRNPPEGFDTRVTHEAIRHRLLTPRGKLYIFWGSGMETGTPPVGSSEPPKGQVTDASQFYNQPTNRTFASVFVESPFGAAVCDCKNGPTPKGFNIVSAHGDAMSLLVDWQVEAYINEADLNGVTPINALVSNRFAQTHEVVGGYTTITTEGTAIFRTDLVYSGNPPLNPDSIRASLFMPIGQGFVREAIDVRGMPDTTGVHYSYRDKQESVNFVAGPYVKAQSISVVHRQAVSSRADILSASPLQIYERVMGLKANISNARAGRTPAAAASSSTAASSRSDAVKDLTKAIRKAVRASRPRPQRT